MLKRIKKVVSIGICLLLVLSVSACKGTASTKSEGQASSEMAVSSTDNQTASEKDTAQPAKDIVTIKWVTVGGGMPDNYDKWQKHINQYLEKKIGVDLDMEVIPWSDFSVKSTTMLNTNGDYDIMFINLITYASNCRAGDFYDLTDLLKSKYSKLYAVCPEDYWKAVQVDGKIYGIPAYKDSSMSQYFIWDADIAEKYGVDYQNIHDLEGLTDGLEKIHKGENKPVYIMNRQGTAAPVNLKYDGLGLGLAAIGVGYQDTSRKVVSVYEQKDVMKDLETLHKWYKDGIINQDAPTADQSNGYSMFDLQQGWSTAAQTVWGPQKGIKNCVAVQYGNTVMSNETVQGSLSCISASSKNPEKALDLLQLVNTDSYVRDALFYGLEGDNFKYTPDKKVEKLNTNWTMAGYTQGTFFNVTPLADQKVDQWAEVKKLNESAMKSPVLGLSIDSTGFADELANCNEIYTRYVPELTTGAKDPAEEVPAMMKELRAAGFDKIVSEVQKQVDAYK